MKKKSLSFYNAYTFAIKAFKESFSFLIGAIILIFLIFYLIASLLLVIFLAFQYININILVPIIFLMGILAIVSFLWLLTWFNYVGLQFLSAHKTIFHENLHENFIDYDVFSISPPMIRHYFCGLLTYFRTIIKPLYRKANPYSYFAPLLALDKSRYKYNPQYFSQEFTNFHAAQKKLTLSSMGFMISLIIVVIISCFKFYIYGLFLALCMILCVPLIIFFNIGMYHQVYTLSDKQSHKVYIPNDSPV